MNINVFGWIRDGVRQSVLLGVSDALQQLGTPHSGDNLHERLQAALEPRPEVAAAVGSGAAKPRRLGRSLKDLDQPPA